MNIIHELFKKIHELFMIISQGCSQITIVNILNVNNHSEFSQLKALTVIMHLEWLSNHDLNLAALNIDDVRDIRAIQCCQLWSCRIAKISMVIFVLFRNLFA
jgi:hypothetical protein